MFGWLFGKKKKSKKNEEQVQLEVQEQEEAEEEVVEKEKAKEEVVEKEEVKVEKQAEPKKRKATNHITKHPQGGWQIKKSGAQRAQKRFKTQKEAIEYAKHLEETTDIAYVIHKADGTTRKKTY